MADWKKLPVAAEAAIAAAIKEVGDAGADKIVIGALVQAIAINLYGADFELRNGFRHDAKGYIDLSGRDYLAMLKGV